jgi:membrane-associated protease RseP (regulator of RpoE activity)
LGVTIDTPAEVVSATGVARRPRGAMVTAVAPRSPADVAGVKAGDRIVAVDGRLVNSVQDLVGELARFEPGQKLKIQYSRGDRLDTADVALATRDQIAQASAAATEPPKTAATPNTTQTPGGNKSILGGLGSALGGLLAGKGNGATTEPTNPPVEGSGETASSPKETSEPSPPNDKPLGAEPLPLEVDPTPLESLKPEPLPATAPERLP